MGSAFSFIVSAITFVADYNLMQGEVLYGGAYRKNQRRGERRGLGRADACSDYRHRRPDDGTHGLFSGKEIWAFPFRNHRRTLSGGERRQR